MVSIIMGSKSDRNIMEKAGNLLEDLGISCEMKIYSAHRLPDETRDYVKSLGERGFEVIIAGAGLAAHLPGVIASHTTLPVIGIPLESGSLRGVDSLYSIVQMPPGIPVATVGINGVKNAALLAGAILAIKYPKIKQAVEDYREKMKEDLRKANEGL